MAVRCGYLLNKSQDIMSCTALGSQESGRDPGWHFLGSACLSDWLKCCLFVHLSLLNVWHTDPLNSVPECIKLMLVSRSVKKVGVGIEGVSLF